MRSAHVIFKNEVAGLLTQHDDGSFTFKYTADWVNDIRKPDISPTLPKRKEKYHSGQLFPFFFNMLPEGSNKQVVCQQNKVDADDYFSQLIITAGYDNIGAVRLTSLR